MLRALHPGERVALCIELSDCEAKSIEHRLMEVTRPKRPPTRIEIIAARKKAYQAMSDLCTEIALRWSLKEHHHSMKRVDYRCRWCVIERKVLTTGHMASKQPAPRWWILFMGEYRNRLPATS